LSKMNYKICFRNELVNNQVKTKEHYYFLFEAYSCWAVDFSLK
jgi:hypothetical protein